MRRVASVIAVLVAAVAPALAAERPIRDPDTTGSISGRAPWNQPWQYDSGSDNDRRPDRPYYQQGGGQQTGGPARNLIPEDTFHIVPR